MAIIGVGTDIVEIARIEKQAQISDKLAERVLTPHELEQYHGQKFKARYLAKRFAAKEAAVKAIGNGIGNGVGFQHVEVRNKENGQPYLVLSGQMEELCQQAGIARTHISISDEQKYAVATVILESF